MKLKTGFLLLIVFFASCKSKKSVAELDADKVMAASKVIQGHYENTSGFKTVNIKSTAKYKDNDQTHSVTADIRIIKDQKIWINVKFLGFPAAKALITPTKVSYYEKINNTYFEGDFQVLSNWLGTDLDFQKIQNLLLGKAIDDLTKTIYIASVEDNFYKLTEKNSSLSATEKQFYFEAANFLIKKEKIAQKQENRSLEIEYPSFTKLQGIFIPNEILLKAQQDEKVTIALQYKNVTFDENFSTSFSIPSGYEEVKIN